MPDALPPIGTRVRVRCGCVWRGERCPNEATAEDGLCNWCAPHGARTDEQLRADPAALLSPDGELWGIGGAGQLHDAPLAEATGASTAACWYRDSERAIAPPVAWFTADEIEEMTDDD
jgi:hypothetical protein